jgi:predicted transcriptional regulator
MPGSKDYDPTRPDGAKLWKTADDLYYPEVVDYDKKTGTMVRRGADGKRITYNVKNREEYEKYNPVKEVIQDDGTVVYTNKDGDITYRTKKRTQKSTKMAETDDANTLVSTYKHPMELVYADYANSMKALANQARIEMKTTTKIDYSSTAKTTYQNEVNSLLNKLNDALLNTTRERQALRLANAEVESKKKKYEEEHDGQAMKPGDVKKISQQAVSKYRQEVQSIARRDRNIEITDREWEAIQAGAVSETTLKKVLNNTDIDKLRERATPRTYNTLSEAQVNRAKALASSNYTIGEIANKLGVSTSTVSKYLKGDK